MERKDRILKIVEVVRKAVRGDYSGRLDLAGQGDELDTLAQSLGELIDHLRQIDAEWRRLENAQQVNAEKYRLLEASIPAVVYLHERHPDGSESFPFVSTAARHLFQLDPEALMQDASLLWSLLHPDDKKRCEESLASSAAAFQPWKEELRFVVNGQVRWCECLARPEPQLSGSVLWSGIMLDITEKKRAEEAQRDSEAKYRRLYETMMDAFVSTDEEGRILESNGAYQAMLGYKAEELRGLSLWDITPTRWHHLDRQMQRKVFEEGYSDVYEKELLHKDGRIVPVELRSYVMRDGSGRATGMWSIVRDISRRKGADEERAVLESQLIQAQRMESIGRLAGGVAHDFNNMLSVILGSVELLKGRLSAKDPLMKEIKAIEKAASHSRDVTRQLLAFSRKQVIEPRPLNLNALIGETQKTLVRLLGEDLELRFEPGENLAKIQMDPAQLDQVLLNLATNARDAMPKGGKLTIKTANVRLDEEFCRKYLGSRPGDYVLLEVRDTGMGMDENTLSHVFEPFFTTKEIGKGTGLGLATVYGIVKQNGGFIAISSEVGRGTSVRIYLPKIAEEDKAAEQAEEGGADISGRVLLVEDDEMVRDITRDILEEIGYAVVVAEDPLQAVSLCEKEGDSIDLVITDVVMPTLSGRQLRERIEQVRPGIKVLFMSGYPSDIIAQHGILEEGVHFIQKPFKIKDLAQKVQQLMGER